MRCCHCNTTTTTEAKVQLLCVAVGSAANLKADEPRVTLVNKPSEDLTL